MIVLAGCGTGEDAVPDAKPVSADVSAAARQKEIDGPREFARKRGREGTGTSRTFRDE
jgi:hypothetical protein